MKTISVIIPVFNRKALVKEMIKCIIVQNHKYWELILVDDGSTDGTLEMMYDYSKTDDRIQIVKRHRLPKGGQTCRNLGLELASGEYVVFFDSDDLVSCTCLQKRVEFMEMNKEIDFGVFPAKSFTNPASFKNLAKYDHIWGVKTNKDDLSLFLKVKYPFLVCTNIYRRESLLINKIIWDENVMIYQDFDFSFSTLIAKLKYRYANNRCDNFDYFYRVQHAKDTTSSHHISEEKFKSTIKLFSKVFDNIKKLNKSSYYHKKFFSFFLFYFEIIIFSQSPEFMHEYLNFGRKHYTYFKILKLDICSKFLMNNRKKEISMNLYKIIICLFFPKIEIYERIIKKLKTKDRLFPC